MGNALLGANPASALGRSGPDRPSQAGPCRPESRSTRMVVDVTVTANDYYDGEWPGNDDRARSVTRMTRMTRMIIDDDDRDSLSDDDSARRTRRT